MTYNQLPVIVKENIIINCDEFLFYQYMPVKFPNNGHILSTPVMEDRLNPFKYIVDLATQDFFDLKGYHEYKNTYIYLTVKNMFQIANTPINRPGWHSDGFLTDDINYIWYNNTPTIFNSSNFDLSLDDSLSLEEMNLQVDLTKNIKYFNNTLLRLNQFCIHRAADVLEPSLRTFLKISFSKDKYDLKGNTHNYNINYNWQMRDRSVNRNVPQKIEC